MTFEVNPGATSVSLTLQANAEELAFTDFTFLSSEQPSDNWYLLTPRKPFDVQSKVRLNLKLLSSYRGEARSPDQLPDCRTCTYMQGLALSQQRELSRMEESKDSFTAIKQILVKYSEGGAKIVDAELGELGIGLKPFDAPRPLNKQEAQHLIEVNTGLNSKLKGMQMILSEVRGLRDQLLESESKRVNLQETARETATHYENQQKRVDQTHKELVQLRHESQQEVLQLKQKCSDQVLENDGLRGQIASLNGKIEYVQVDTYNYKGMTEQIKSLQNELETSQIKREALRKSYDQSQADFELEKQKQLADMKRLQEEKQELLQEIERLNKKINGQIYDNEVLTNKNHDLESTQRKLEAQIKSLQDENQELAQTRKIAAEREAQCVAYQAKLEEAARVFESQLDNMQTTYETLQNAKGQVMAELTSTENVLETKIQQLQDTGREVERLTAVNLNLEQHLVVQEDRQTLLATLQKQHSHNKKCKDVLIDELNTLARYLQRQSTQCLALSQTIVGCKHLLQDKELAQDKLGSVVESLRRTRPTYVPHKTDPLDAQVAAYLQERDDWMTVSFYRKSAGEYVLGKKQVSVHYDSPEKTLYARLGKGTMPLSEFLDTYIPLEANRRQAFDSTTLRQKLVESYLGGSN